MATLSITYGSYSFTDTGRAQFSRQARFEPTEGERPQRKSQTITVSQWFGEGSFADNQARWRAMAVALDTPEGVLEIKDENGVSLFSGRVRVAGHDLPEQWGQHILETSVEFRVLTETLTASATNAVFTPTGGVAVTLPGVDSYREQIRTDRHTSAAPNRRETLVSIDIAGTLLADKQLDADARRAWLLAQKDIIESCADSKDGLLVFAGTSELVRVETIEAVAGDESLDWSMGCFYRRFPDGDHAEAEYDVTSRDSHEKSERMVTVRGQVRSQDQAGAEAKAASLKAAHAEGRMLLSSEQSVQLLSGEDGEAFAELSFSFEFRETISNVSWTLSVSDRKDLRNDSLITSYSGSVTAATSAAALAKARALGDGKYPIRISSQETVNSRGVDAGDQFVELSFSYEYSRKGGTTFAEVSGDTDDQTFGDSSMTIQGYAACDTEAAALSLARSFKVSGYVQRVNRESVQTIRVGGTAQHVKVDFSYVYGTAHASSSIKYTVDTAKDYEARTKTVTYSGTAYGATEAACDALIDSTVAPTAGGRRTRDQRGAAYEVKGGDSLLLAKQFSVSASFGLEAVAGESILEAEYQVNKTLSLQKYVMTFIPYGTSHVQNNVGLLPGAIQVTGSVTALTESAARSWGQAKRSLATPTGAYEDQPQENMHYLHEPKSGVSLRAYRFDFTYAAKLVNLAG